MHIVNPAPSRRELLATGFAGLGGALLLFTGDMLMYGHWGSGATFGESHRQVMVHASTLRLFAAGVMGPLSLPGYLAGALHVYWRVAQSPSWLRVAAGIGFAVTFILGCAEHVVLGAAALAVRATAEVPAAKPAMIAISAYLGFLYQLAEIAGYPTMLLFIVLVLFKKTTYPRWTALVNPGLLMLLSPLADHIPAPLGAVFVGGTYNLSCALLFLISLLTFEQSPPTARLELERPP